jgi:predicted RND superfamily exporter protein
MHPNFVSRVIRFAVDNPILILIVIAGISGFFGYHALQVKINPDIEGLIPEDERVTQMIKKYTGGEHPVDHVVVAVRSENPFDIEKLNALERAIKQLEELPQLKESTNPFNMITFSKDGMRIDIHTMAPDKKAPDTEEELQVFKQRITGDPLAEKLVISEDGDTLCIFFPTTKMEKHSQFKSNVDTILEDLKKHYTVYISGTPIFVNTVKQYLTTDLSRLILLAILVILIIYYFGYHAFRAPLLTLMVVTLGTIWCVGSMALLGFTISIVSIVTPPLVLTLGSSYTIHILNQYYREAVLHSEENHHGEKNWIVDVVSHVNKTVLMAATTTVLGFLSLLVTLLRPTREFGIATSIGIISCALLSFVLLPAVLSLLKNPSRKQQKRVSTGFMSTAMGQSSKFIIKRRKIILAFLLLVVVFSVLLFNQLRYETDVISYFPRREKVVQDTKFIATTIGGIQEYFLTLNAPEEEENFFLQQDVLRRIGELETKLLQDKDVSKVISFVAYLKQLNQVMFGKHEIPESKALIKLMSRYVKAISQNPEANQRIKLMANDNFSRLTLTIWAYDSEKQTIISDRALEEFVERVRDYADTSLEEEIDTDLWSESLRFLALSRFIKHDQRVATGLSVLFVFIFTMIAFRSVKFGFLSLIPLLTAIMLNVILMVVFNIPMDMTTVMFSIVVIGVGVDNSIHFLIQFRRQRELYPNNIEMALANTLKFAGRPIAIITISIVIGFLVLTLASFIPIKYFGLLVAMALSTAALGSLIVLPAVLTITEKDQVDTQQ